MWEETLKLFPDQIMMAMAYSFLDAQKAAFKAAESMVMKQSYLLTYLDAYWISGLVMLCGIPLVFTQRVKKNATVPADVH